MNEKIEKAIEVLSEKMDGKQYIDSQNALKYSQAVLNLTHALNNLKT